MKSRIFLKTSLIIFTLLIISNISAINVFANETQLNLEKEEIYETTLENLLQDEEEQKIVKELFEENYDKAEIEENNYNVQIYNSTYSAEITTYTDTDYYYAKEWGYSNEYVSIPGSNSGYDYIIYYSTSEIKVNKHDIVNQTNTQIASYTNDETKLKYITYAVRDNVLYILYIKGYDSSYAWGTEYDTSWIMGVDLEKGSIVYEQSFDCPQDCTYLPSFTVDGNQNFYFVYRNTGTKIFDKSGKLLFDREPLETTGYKNYFKGVSPNNKVLFFQVMYLDSSGYAYFQSVYEGMQSLNNGVFTYPDEYTVYGRTYPSNYSYEPRWYFYDSSNSTYAVDQYGRIAKFEYDLTTNMGASREIILNLNADCYDYYYYEAEDNVSTYKDGIIYVFGSNKNVYRVDSETFEIKDYIKTNIEYESSYLLPLYKMRIIDDNLYLHIKTSSSKSSYRGVERCISLNESNFTKNKKIIYSEHSTDKHTIDEIVEKYVDTKPTFDYSTSMYEEEPSWKSPYAEGSLKEGAINDALNKLNYYRWLVSVDEVSINSERMYKNQRGAVLLQAINRLTHYPSQPSDMDDTFYKDGREGVSASYSYTGNCAYGSTDMVDSVMGFVSDIDNVASNSTGHRQSLLDPTATQTSFGIAGRYSAMSMYIDSTKDITSEDYYAYPPAGNFPNTEMKTDQLWSLYDVGEHTGTISVNFTYNNKVYPGYIYSESGWSVMNFKLPDDLINELGGAGKNIPAGTSIKVEVLGYVNGNFDDVKFEYTVNFFDINKELLGDIEITTIPYKKLDNKDVMEFESKVKIETIITETNFPVKAIDYEVEVYSKNGVKKTQDSYIGSQDIIYVSDTAGNVIAEFTTFVKGDVNGDGKVRIYDAFQILKDVLVPGTKLTEIDMQIRDFNGDGKVRIYDAFQFLKQAILN